METTEQFKTELDESFEPITQMAKDTGYLTCINDVLNYIKAAKDENGNVKAEYLEIVLKTKTELLKSKHVTA